MDFVTFVATYSTCGINRHAAIVADVLMLARNFVVERGLATIRVTDNGNSDMFLVSYGHNATKVRKNNYFFIPLY